MSIESIFERYPDFKGAVMVLAGGCLSVDELIGDMDVLRHDKRTMAKVKRITGGNQKPLNDACRAIYDVVVELYKGFNPSTAFVVDVYQAGAGTSLNMNINEVLARVANLGMFGNFWAKASLHPKRLLKAENTGYLWTLMMYAAFQAREADGKNSG